MIGVVGSAIPLGALYYLYNRMVLYVAVKFGMLAEILKFLQVNELFRTLLPIGMALGIGIYGAAPSESIEEAGKQDEVTGFQNYGSFYNSLLSAF